MVCSTQSAFAEMMVILVNQNSMSYELGPTNYANSPTNYENSSTNYDNSVSNYDNSPSNYDNSPSKYENSNGISIFLPLLAISAVSSIILFKDRFL